LKNQRKFSKITSKKIKNIYKIINGNDKFKPKLNMTMKGLSRKQVIVPMNNENKVKFIKEFNAHITNLNSTLNQKSWQILYAWTK